MNEKGRTALFFLQQTMSLNQKIADDMKEAMKAQDATRLSTLRMLKSSLKNKQIDLQHDLTDDEVMTVVKTQIKQLKDSVSEFEKAGRGDLAEPAKGEIALLEVYLPAQLDDASVEAKVRAALTEAGISSKADAGRAMGVAMKAVAGLADGTRVKAAVEKILE
jgi:uncharacterized protein YqeY